jgi:hypothetical protein
MTVKLDFIKQIGYTEIWYCFKKIGVIFKQVVRHEKIKVTKMIPEEKMPKFNEQKTTEAASILLRLNGGEMNYMKLIKLLYFIDKKSIKEKDRPITNDIYYSMKDGQVLSTVLDYVRNKKIGNYWHQHIIEGKRQFTVRLIGAPLKPSKLSPSEVDIIESVFTELGKFDQFYLGNLTKKGSEYKKTTSRIETPIEDIFLDLGFGNQDIDEIKEMLKEKAYLDTLFEL